MTISLRLRAFLALNVSVAQARAAAALQEELRGALGDGLAVAWVPPAQLHLTLKFLGAIPVEAVEGIRDPLRARLAGRPPVEVRLSGAGAFPTAQAPRVLWVGADGGAPLRDLAAEVERWMVELGFPREERPFRPHLTIGRIKQGEASVDEALGRFDGRDLGASVCREVVLYESRARAQGAEYVALARMPLGGGTPGPATREGKRDGQRSEP